MSASVLLRSDAKELSLGYWAAWAVVVLYYLVIAPGRSPDPMLTPLGSWIEYLITTPAFIALLAAIGNRGFLTSG